MCVGKVVVVAEEDERFRLKLRNCKTTSGGRLKKIRI